MIGGVISGFSSSRYSNEAKVAAIPSLLNTEVMGSVPQGKREYRYSGMVGDKYLRVSAWATSSREHQ